MKLLNRQKSKAYKMKDWLTEFFDVFGEYPELTTEWLITYIAGAHFHSVWRNGYAPGSMVSQFCQYHQNLRYSNETKKIMDSGFASLNERIKGWRRAPPRSKALMTLRPHTFQSSLRGAPHLLCRHLCSAVGILVIWVSSALLVLPTLLYSRVYRYVTPHRQMYWQIHLNDTDITHDEEYVYMCIENWPKDFPLHIYSAAVLVGEFIIPILIMIAAHVAIGITLIRSQALIGLARNTAAQSVRRLSTHRPRTSRRASHEVLTRKISSPARFSFSSVNSSIHKPECCLSALLCHCQMINCNGKKFRAFRLLVLIIAFFIICWTPYYAYMTWREWWKRDWQSNINRVNLFYAVEAIAMSNSMFNAIFNIVLNHNVRLHARNLLWSIRCSCLVPRPIALLLERVCKCCNCNTRDGVMRSKEYSAHYTVVHKGMRDGEDYKEDEIGDDDKDIVKGSRKEAVQILRERNRRNGTMTYFYDCWEVLDLANKVGVDEARRKLLRVPIVGIEIPMSGGIRKQRTKSISSVTPSTISAVLSTLFVSDTGSMSTRGTITKINDTAAASKNPVLDEQEGDVCFNLNQEIRGAEVDSIRCEDLGKPSEGDDSRVEAEVVVECLKNEMEVDANDVSDDSSSKCGEICSIRIEVEATL